MREWVQDFLLRLGDERISRESLEKEVAVPVFCYRRLTRLFNINWSDERLTELFGSVLGRLDESIFLQLVSIRNLYFFYSRSLGMVQGLNFAGDQPGIMCVFSSQILSLSDSEIRGAIAHEFAHVLLGHCRAEAHESHLTAEMELQADQKAIEMGFEYEIEKIRDYLNQGRRI